MTIFVDTDKTAYLIHSSNWNKTLNIARLTEDYTNVDGLYVSVLIDQEREAPAICYRDGMRGEKPVILCFVEKGETKTIFGRWRTGNALHHRHLIAPDYSRELHEVVKACCPMEIADLRPTPDYAQ